MAKDTVVCILETKSETEFYPYRSPVKFGGRVINDVTLLNVSVRGRTLEPLCEIKISQDLQD